MDYTHSVADNIDYYIKYDVIHNVYSRAMPNVIWDDVITDVFGIVLRNIGLRDISTLVQLEFEGIWV
jgi:hypothetical protein